VCPLSRVPPGTAVKVKRLFASPEHCRRLREMGVREELELKLLLKNRDVVCKVCNRRLALSGKLADAILVQPLCASEPARLPEDP